MTGHLRPESPVTLARNRRSPSSGIRGHVGPEYAIGTVGVLRQAAIAYFHKPPHPLEGQKRMFDFRPHSRFSAVGLPIAWAQSAVPVRTLVGEVLGARGNPLELLALVFSPISAVAIQPTLFTMQQI